MLFLLKRIFFISLKMGVAVVLLTGSVFGSVADYNSFVQGYADTIVCYDFEGTTDTERQQNKANTSSASDNDLIVVDLIEGGGSENITYISGFDETSTAYEPYLPYDGYRSFGKALSTNNPLPLTTAVSYEAIVCPIAFDSGNARYAVASYASGPCRSYFTVLEESGLTAAFGQGDLGVCYFVSRDEDDEDGSAFLNKWYYVALSMSYDDNQNETTMTLYSANLTAGDSTLSTSSNTMTGSFLTNYAHGIGGVTVNGTDCQQAADVNIDQIVFYDGAKDSTFFQANLQRILYGEVQEDIPGDANRDGRVDGSDVTILAGNWQAGVGDPDPSTVTWEMGDFNGDGQIDGSDVTILAGNWQAGVEAAAASVPEPSALVLLLVCGLALCLGRRSR